MKVKCFIAEENSAQPFHLFLIIYIHNAAIFAADRDRRISSIIAHLLTVNARTYGPLFLLLENMQWIDPASLNVLRDVCLKCTNGILIFFTVRSLTHCRQELREIATSPHNLVLPLSPLSSKEIERLCCLRLRIKKLPKNFSRFVVRASNGNPLFVKELLLSIIQHHSKLKIRRNKASEDNSSTKKNTESESEDEDESILATIFHGDIVGLGVSSSSSIQSIMTSRIDLLTPSQQVQIHVHTRTTHTHAHTHHNTIHTNTGNPESG